MSRIVLLIIAMTGCLTMSPGIRGQVTTGSAAVKIYTFQLGRGGCQPGERRVPAGLVGIHLLNSSHQQNLNLILHPDGGLNLSTKTLTGSDPKWTQLVMLTAGTYILEAPGETSLRCTIIAQ